MSAASSRTASSPPSSTSSATTPSSSARPISSVIDERALRELYLVPFEVAVREGGALGHHDGVQPAQRALAHPAARVPPRHPARRVGFRGPGDDRLVRRRRDDRVARRRARPRDAGSGPRARPGAWSTAIEKGDVDESDLDDSLSAACSADSTESARSTLPSRRVDPKAPTPADVALLRRAAAESIVLSAQRRHPAPQCTARHTRRRRRCRTPSRRPSWAAAPPR